MKNVEAEVETLLLLECQQPNQRGYHWYDTVPAHGNNANYAITV